MIDGVDRKMAVTLQLGAAVGTLPALLFFGLLLLLGRLPGAPARPFTHHHFKQALRLHLTFWLVSLLSCGLGFVLLAIPVLLLSLKAARAAEAGEWFQMPWVGGPPLLQ